MKPSKKEILSIAIVLAIGAVLAALILATGKPEPSGPGEEETSHAQNEAETQSPEPGIQKGPHGGKLFNRGGYGVEVTIFEAGVEP